MQYELLASRGSGATETAATIDASSWLHKWAPLVSMLVVCGWVALAASVNPAQFADSIEQYNWSHSLEWGYWKHPPLTTWLMRACIALMGVSHWTSYAAAAACHVATVWFTWRLALRLMPRTAAAFAILLLPLHHALSWRAQVFNHNTTLLLASSALVWSAVRASQTKRRPDWMLVGMCCGLAMLAKYQAAVPIAAVLAALWKSGDLRDPRVRRGVALAAAVAFLIFLPHLLWEISHAFPTWTYVEASAPVLAPAVRIPALMKFLGSQIGLFASVLIAAAAVAFWPASRASTAVPAGSPTAREMTWLWSIVLVPLIAVSAVVLASGFKPPRDWGLQTFQFLPLLLAALLAQRVRPVSLNIPFLLSIFIGTGTAFFYVHQTTDPIEVHRLHSADRVIPARELAVRVMRDWREVTACRLHYVQGNGFIAGLVSVYSGEDPQVLEAGDSRRSPWVDLGRMTEDGAIIIGRPRPSSPGASGDARSLAVPASAKDGGFARIDWQVVPPRHSCAP